jgi:hypothetical protein
MDINALKMEEYIRLYKISRDQLPTLIPALTDEEVRKQVSQRDWLIFPLPYEVARKQAVNRPDPHIDITLREPGKVRIGIRCNTIKSVEKLKNILNGYHKNEKKQLINHMTSLDDRFLTSIMSKQKEYNFAQAPKHEVIFQERSNTIDEDKITKIFGLLDEIRQRGIDKKKEMFVDFLPEAPVIDLTSIKLSLDEKEYRLALSDIGKIFETCISIKTRSEIEREEKRAKKGSKIHYKGYICQNCKTKFPLENKPMFCPKCGSHISQRY